MASKKAGTSNMDKVQQYFKNEYEKLSSFQKNFGCDYTSVSSHGENHWNMKFRSNLLDFLANKQLIDRDIANLEYLEKFIDPEYLEFKQVEKAHSRPLINDLIFEFIELQDQQNLYHDFLKWIRKDVVKKNFYFQRIPTVRIHMPGAEGKQFPVLPHWHADSILGHSPREFNIWFGLTESKHSDFWIVNVENSRKWYDRYNFDRKKWIDLCFSSESEFNKDGFKNSEEVLDIFNNIFFFDSRCIHTPTYRNDRDLTIKISIDVRILLVEDYEWLVLDGEPVFRGIGIQKADFKPGSKYGFHEKTVEEIME